MKVTLGTIVPSLVRRARSVLRRLRGSVKPYYAGYLTVYLRERLLPRRRSLVLNLGCGEHRVPGAVNIDRRNTPAADVVCTVTRLPYRKASVRRIESYHVLEHLPRAVAERALDHWFALLEPGGTLVVECPDFDSAVGEYLSGNDGRLGNIFGLQRFPGDFHLWGWNARRLTRTLLEIGFTDVKQPPATDYHTLSEPCLRIEGVKPTDA